MDTDEVAALRQRRGHHTVFSEALSQFLHTSAESIIEVGDRPRRYPESFLAARDQFVLAGMHALSDPAQLGPPWMQIHVRPTINPPWSHALYGGVAALVEHLIAAGSINNFFFMHKPPGLRLRFQIASSSDPVELQADVQRQIEDWLTLNLLDAYEYGTYEPEHVLFGGRALMPFVHSLFTLESLFWLEYYGDGYPDRELPPDPAWLVSLAIADAVLEGLGITGWEDLNVWDYIRFNTGRSAIVDTSASSFSEFSRHIADIWGQREGLTAGLDDDTRSRIARYRPVLVEAAAQLRIAHSRRLGRPINIRTVCALLVIFDWNRAALSIRQQSILAEILASRMG